MHSELIEVIAPGDAILRTSVDWMPCRLVNTSHGPKPKSWQLFFSRISSRFVFCFLLFLLLGVPLVFALTRPKMYVFAGVLVPANLCLKPEDGLGESFRGFHRR